MARVRQAHFTQYPREEWQSQRMAAPLPQQDHMASQQLSCSVEQPTADHSRDRTVRKVRKMWRSCFQCKALFADNQFAREGLEVTAWLHEDNPMASVAPGACDPCLETLLREHGVTPTSEHTFSTDTGTSHSGTPIPPTSKSAEQAAWSSLVARFDADRDGALNFGEFEMLLASLLGGCVEYGTAAEVARQISAWVGFAGAPALTPELLCRACCEGTVFGPLQPALVAARDATGTWPCLVF